MINKNNIFLIGPMGVGKSSIGKYLSSELKMNFFDSDTEIEKKTGKSINFLFKKKGEEKFRIMEKKIISSLTKKKKIVLSTGGGVVISYINRKKLFYNGIVIYLKTTINNQLLRIQYDNKRPLLKKKKITEKKKILELLNDIREIFYKEIADLIIHNNNCDIKIIIFNILKIIKKFNLLNENKI